MGHFTEKQIGDLSAKLDGTHVRKNPKGFDYIEGWQTIAEANRIFGFDGWSRELINLKMLADPYQNEKQNWVVSYGCTVRITVRAGDATVLRDGSGYGSGFSKDIGAAHESAIKEAETDAMKRALMTFGNPFGLALYDKSRENVETADARDGGLKRDNRNDRSPADEFFERAKREISNHIDPVALKAWVELNIGHLNALPVEQGKLLYSQYEKRMGALASSPNLGKAA